VIVLLDQVQAIIDRFPDRIAVHHVGRDWTYGEIWQWSQHVAKQLLEVGVQPGDRVGLILGNSIEYVVAYLGTWLAGGIVVAVNPATTPRDLSRTLAHAEPNVIVTHPDGARIVHQSPEHWQNLRQLLVTTHRPASRPLETSHFPTQALVDGQSHQGPAGMPPSKPDDPAQIIYTSGTSGSPKGVTLSHRNLAANAASIVAYLDLQAADSVFVILPFFYSYGNSLLTTHLSVGGRLILANDFVFWNRSLDLMQLQRATGLAGVPSSFAMLAQKSDFLRRPWPDLRYLTCAGGGLPARLAEQLCESLPHVQLFLMYGQTEATARLSTLLPADLPHKLGSIGRAIPGVTLELLDGRGQPVPPGEIGEIVARGENLMQGYWRDPVETARALRPEGLRTGDLARADADGYLYVVGRQSDLIKSGAYRIHPQELEEVLYELPGVVEAAVAGLHDPILSEVPVAFIVLDPAISPPPLPAELLAAANQKLPRYKALREVRVVDSLPKTPSGKIRRSELRAAPSQPSG